LKRLVILIAGFIIVPAALATQFDQVWVNAYNGQYDPCDEGGRCVTVAADGYIYACGQGLGALSIYDDFITMKLNPGTGETLWVQYYDGPGRRRDSALAIAVDNSGGVYVTGRSWGSGYDYATVKYNAADGRQCWVARYNAGGTLNDFATAIAVDNSGGVYVTGFSAGSGFTGDYVTIKYDAADGSQCWLARYDGAGDDDFATAIAVDNAGGVYVTGYSYASSSYYDYATVKYSAADGSESWVARYGYSAPDRAYAIAVDNSGGVYVTGYTFSYDHINDYATVKYNASDGSPAWLGNPGIDDRGAARYNGPGNSADVAYAIAVDNAGGVYVTGQSSGSGAGFDYATVKYSAADGSQGWVARYNGPGNSNDYANGIAVDNAGGVYVTGYSRGPDGYDDYATVKYNTSDGSESWVERYNGSGNNADRAYSVAAGNSGGVYVTGFAGSANTTKDFVTVKYAASDGGQAWAACWNLTKSNESGQKVVCDADGYVYTCGHGSSPLDGYGDFITIKYDPATGETLWLRYYDSPDYHSDDQATAIAVDNSGGVYVTGYNFVNGGVVYDWAGPGTS